MAKGHDTPAEPSEKQKRNQTRLFRLGHTFELETDREAALFSTVAPDVEGYAAVRAGRVTGGKASGEPNMERDCQMREWAEEIRAEHPDWPEHKVATEIEANFAPKILSVLRQEAVETADAHRYADATAIKRDIKRWGIGVHRIRKIIQRK